MRGDLLVTWASLHDQDALRSRVVSTVGRLTHERPRWRQDSSCCVGGVNLSWPCTNTTTKSYPASGSTCCQSLSWGRTAPGRSSLCMVPTSSSLLWPQEHPQPPTLYTFFCTHNVLFKNFLFSTHSLPSTNLPQNSLYPFPFSILAWVLYFSSGTLGNKYKSTFSSSLDNSLI